LSEDYWRTRFGADPGIVGQVLRLDGDPYTVVGVVPAEAQLIGRTSLFGLRPIRGLPERARGGYGLQTIARLKPGVSPEVARDELARIAADSRANIRRRTRGAASRWSRSATSCSERI
jgi:putative ABC transport system permease protein